MAKKSKGKKKRRILRNKQRYSYLSNRYNDFSKKLLRRAKQLDKLSKKYKE